MVCLKASLVVLCIKRCNLNFCNVIGSKSDVSDVVIIIKMYHHHQKNNNINKNKSPTMSQNTSLFFFSDINKKNKMQWSKYVQGHYGHCFKS